jgi:RNA polymerase sigma-70 factor (sigma-E family)
MSEPTDGAGLAGSGLSGSGPGRFDDAFPELYRRAYQVAFSMLGSRPEAEDLAQETLARAYLRWKKIEPYATPWVLRVSGNLAIDVLRRRKLTRRVPVPENTPAVDGARIDLQRALATISRRQRSAVILRYFADMSEADVATALGCSVGTVKSHTSRGLAALRGLLEPEEAHHGH